MKEKIRYPYQRQEKKNEKKYLQELKPLHQKPHSPKKLNKIENLHQPNTPIFYLSNTTKATKFLSIYCIYYCYNIVFQETVVNF